MPTIGRNLDLKSVDRVARGGDDVAIDRAALEAMATTRARLESDLAAGHTIYGVNTGFGALAERRIDVAAIRKLQQNLVRSHAVGVGDEVGEAHLERVHRVLSLGDEGGEVVHELRVGGGPIDDLAGDGGNGEVVHIAGAEAAGHWHA